MNEVGVLLKNRTVCAIVSLIFLGEFAWACVSITKGIQHRPEPITGVFALVLAVSFANVAWKSVFWADRIVSGAIAGIGALIAVRALHFSSPATMLALDVARALLYLIAAWASLTVMFTGFRSVSSAGGHIVIAQ
jgi:hypothetical protein